MQQGSSKAAETQKRQCWRVAPQSLAIRKAQPRHEVRVRSPRRHASATPLALEAFNGTPIIQTFGNWLWPRVSEIPQNVSCKGWARN